MKTRLARGAVAAMAGFSVLVAALTMIAGTFGVGQALHLSSNLLLAYLVWRGYGWVRKPTAVLASLAAVLFAVLTVQQIVAADGEWLAAMISGLGVAVYGFVAGCLWVGDR